MKKLFLLLSMAFISVICYSQINFGPPQELIMEIGDPARNYVCATDIDDDGDADVLVGCQWDLVWLENDGTGVFSNLHSVPCQAQGIYSIFAEDLDGDGDTDIASTSWYNSQFAWHENTGSGNFGDYHIVSSEDGSPSGVFAVDLDGDYDPDLLCAFYDKITWFSNDGSGNFGNMQIINDEVDAASTIYAVDIDGDGDADVISGTWNGNRVAWYDNDGEGNFGDQQIISSDVDGVKSVLSVDLDNDNDPDVLSASYRDGKIAWYKNDGLGNFGPQQIISSDPDDALEQIYAEDIDGDDDPDVLAASYNDKLAWYENDGEGNFGDQFIITTSAIGATSIFATDLDGDNDVDVLAAYDSNQEVNWYQNLENEILYFDYEFCEGDSIFLMGDWIFTEGTYVDSLVNINGGDSIVAHIVNVIPAPDSVIISGKKNVDEFEVSIYSVPIVAGVYYSWDVENGNLLEINDNFVQIQWGSNGAGKVAATITSYETGCSRQTILEVFVGDNGIIDLAETDIMIYPNPAEQFLHFSGSDLLGTQIELFDISGKLLYKKHIANNKTSIDIRNISPGIISIKITGDFGTGLKKIIKQ